MERPRETSMERAVLLSESIDAIPARAASRYPERTAVVTAETGSTLTFADFDDRTTRAAAAFHDAGLRPGDRIGFVAGNSVDLLVAGFGASRAGLVGVYNNVELMPETTAWQLRKADVDAVAFDANRADLVRPFVEDSGGDLSALLSFGGDQSLAATAFDEWLQGPSASPPEVSVDGDEPAVIMFTSGTTDRPKGVVHTHRSYTAGALNTALGGDVRRRDVQTAVLPLFHIHQDLWTKAAFLVGATTVLYRRFDPTALIDDIERYGVTYVNLMASMYRRLLDEADPGAMARSTVRRCVYGMPMEPSLRERVATAFEADLQLVYGQTEALIATFLDPEWQLVKDGNYVGHAAPLMEVGVLDEEGEQVDEGDVGEIAYRGPTIMAGYLDDEAATTELWRDGWHRSGDVGLVDEDGVLLFVDRKKDMIKTGGENVSSVTVENCLGDHPAVSACTVVGLPHERWGEAVTAFVVLHDDATVTEAELLEHCRQGLARFEVPKAVEFVEELPYTATGKVQKATVADRHRDYYS